MTEGIFDLLDIAITYLCIAKYYCQGKSGYCTGAL